MTYFPKCPACNKVVLEFHLEEKKRFCPYCKAEIIIIAKNKYILVILGAAAGLPLLFNRLLFPVLSVIDNFRVYLWAYYVLLATLAFIYVFKNVTRERVRQDKFAESMESKKEE